jgi:DNA-directed RNA polymerase subunit RPC12/RpoP
MSTKWQNQVFLCVIGWSTEYFVLNKGRKRDSLQKVIFVYVCSTCSVVEIKKRIATWITRNDVNGPTLFHLSYLITLRAYLCSQSAPNVQIKYFMFDSSMYRLFVLNRSWKRDSLQMMIFVYVCSTCSVVELKTRFETWITRNDVNFLI